jgi:hypothetical protein
MTLEMWFRTVFGLRKRRRATVVGAMEALSAAIGAIRP